MKTIKKILFPTDFSVCANHAFNSAIKMAKRYNAELQVLHVSILPISDPYSLGYYYPDPNNAKKMLESHVKNELARIVKNHGVQPIKITTKQLIGLSPAPVILEHAKSNDIDLIVIGTHGRRSIRHAMMGSVAEEVVRLSQQSVLTVPMHENDAMDTKQSILVPVDFSTYSKKALAAAKELAGQFNYAIDIIHVIPNAFQIHPEGVEFNLFKSYPNLIDNTKSSLSEMFIEIGGPELPVDHHVLVGVPAVEISDLANKNKFALIMTSTHGITGIKKLMLGSVTEKLVKLSQVPVLVIK